MANDTRKRQFRKLIYEKKKEDESRKRLPRLPRQRPWHRGTTTWEGITKSGIELRGELTLTGTSFKKHLEHNSLSYLVNIATGKGEIQT